MMSRPGDGREYPAVPRVGAAAVVVDRGRVLLVRRARQPMLGDWSLPGGLLELGETLLEGVRREVLEETRLLVRPVEIVATLDKMVRDRAGRLQYHYVLVDWLCAVEDGASRAPVCGDDAADARWVERSDLEGASVYSLQSETLQVIDRAIARLGQGAA